MKNRVKNYLVSMVVSVVALSCSQHKTEKGHENNPYYSTTDTTHLDVSNTDWKKILPGNLYAVARQKGTEKAFTGKYWKDNPRGTYYCAVCGNKLFKSDAKFSSTCGWPSFFEPDRINSIVYKEDSSDNMQRTEVVCARCDSHLGHIFDDGPPPSHKRFCMNSVCLDFKPDEAVQ
jgi:peptide-methionine (R)-S-oxide reductase